MPAAKRKKAGRSATAASSKKKPVGKRKPTKAVKTTKRRTSAATPKAVRRKEQPKKASKAVKQRTTRTAAPARPVAAKKTVPVAPVAKAAPARPAAKPPAPAARAPRKPRSRIETSATPTASWFPVPNAFRSGSFIPAPPRAEAPSNVAAPPAMADRVVRASDLTGVATTFRIHPIRVDIEYSAGRMLVHPNPEEIHIRAGEGVEWDFRYTGGADLMIEEIVVELPKSSPFHKAQFRAKKPTAPRHRVFSGAAVNGAEFRGEYSIRCLNSFKSLVAATKARLVVERA
jgi:hypothetical protein